MTTPLQAVLERIAAARKNAGLSQAQAARLLGLAGASSLSPIESGDVPLTMERFLAMCDVYEMSPEWAITGVNPYFDPQPVIDAAGKVTEETERLLETLVMMRQQP